MKQWSFGAVKNTFLQNSKTLLLQLSIIFSLLSFYLFHSPPVFLNLVPNRD